jgi:hypothetical protein
MLLVWNIGRYRDVAQEFEPALGRELLASGRVRRPEDDAGSHAGDTGGAAAALPDGSTPADSPVRPPARRGRRG